MLHIRLAELNIRIDNKYPFLQDFCREYLTDEDVPDFTVSVTEDEIFSEDDGSGFEPGYLESLAVYRKIADKILDFGGLLMHGAVIDCLGTGIAFLARSGVGKSTHMSLWQSCFKITVVNGDKPLLRIIGDKVYAYGTPWAGKEKLHTNTKTELKKMCFLERSETNKCIMTDKDKVFEQLIQQIYMPSNPELLLRTIDLLGSIAEKTEFYTIYCNMDISAAKTAYEGLMP